MQEPKECARVARVVSFGGGVNSTALLVGLWQRGERPDVILFADTRGEREETYRHVDLMDRWCARRRFPPILTVRNISPHGSLEQECHNNQTLPSLAFGFKGCSVKWKRQPMDRWVKDMLPHYKGRIERLIGIDADESHRGQIPDDAWFRYRFPLLEWDWGRDECIDAIRQEGLDVPAKSACWFCPASKKAEVLRLAKERPDLFDRAVAIEHSARPNFVNVKGLGRNWSWEALVRADRAQSKFDFVDSVEPACGCYDG